MIDALSPQMSGIGRYCWELCQRVPRQADVDRVHYYRSGGFVRDPVHYLASRQDCAADRLTRRLLPKRWRQKQVQRRLRNSVVHGPNYFLPESAEGGVVTVHDLSVLKYPETHPAERVAHFERDFARSLGRAAAIVTDTEKIRREVIAELGISPDRIHAIHLGVDPRYHHRSKPDVQPYLDSIGLNYRGYGLSVSTLEPRKRIDALIGAWSDLPSALRNRFPMVLAGQKGWLHDRLGPQIDKAISEGWLRWLGFVAEDDLPLLYAGAATFLYPSLYEGFGLPPLEAMASGVPVVVSDRSCLGEVCGDAALYIDPDDHDRFVDMIECALTDENVRIAGAVAGPRRAALFQWERCAEQTAEIYRSLWRDRVSSQSGYGAD